MRILINNWRMIPVAGRAAAINATFMVQGGMEGAIMFSIMFDESHTEAFGDNVVLKNQRDGIILPHPTLTLNQTHPY